MSVLIIKGEEAKYVVSGGHYCPWCKSFDITAQDTNVEGATATQEVVCHSCAKTWTDVFKLIGFDATGCGPD